MNDAADAWKDNEDDGAKPVAITTESQKMAMVVIKGTILRFTEEVSVPPTFVFVSANTIQSLMNWTEAAMQAEVEKIEEEGGFELAQGTEQLRSYVKDRFELSLSEKYHGFLKTEGTYIVAVEEMKKKKCACMAIIDDFKGKQ